MSFSHSRPVSRERIASASVLVVGDAMLDRYWFGEVDRISPEAPVPIVHVRREEYRLGGAANVARNVAALGAQVSLLSVIGDDEAGRRLSTILEESAIKAALRADADFETTVKLRVSGRQQQLLRVDFERRPNPATLTTMIDDFRALAAAHDVIIMSDYGKGILGPIATLIEHARELRRPVLVDPKGSDYSGYRGATIITPNRSELAAVSGAWRDDAELTAKATALSRKLGLEAILVTRSEEGMSLFDAEGELRVTADTREVFDVTGAGDTVIAVLAVLTAAGLSLRDTVPLANRAGGIVVGRFGTSAVTYDDLFAEPT